MAPSALRARKICPVYSPRGEQAEVVLIEPNGDEHQVRVLLAPEVTEINGVMEVLNYLNHRYGPESVLAAAKTAVRTGSA